VTYATERHQFGVPIASFQLVQQLLARIAVDVNSARLLTCQAGHLKDAGRPTTLETSLAKLYASEAAVRCADAALQVHGGFGYVDDHPVERLWPDVRITTLTRAPPRSRS
jgi:butyryl-CoA dehydrogenase